MRINASSLGTQVDSSVDASIASTDETLAAEDDATCSTIGDSTVPDPHQDDVASSRISSQTLGKDKNMNCEVEGKERLPVTGDNMLGKLNNLVTSDLQNLTAGREFLLVILNSPLQFVGGATYLYVVLGWSSLVGLAWYVHSSIACLNGH
jgi:hypothetical protein